MALFEKMRASIQGHIMSSFSSGKAETLEELYNSFKMSDAEKHLIMDQILRDNILVLATEGKGDVRTLNSFITYVIELSRREVCSTSMPVVLLSDVFDVFTLDQCEELFTYVENGVSIWKEDLFFGPCKNNLLRMCNDLLRRLSRSQNTVFRGRILLFLAKFFPFSERSGLNIVSEFNLDSATDYAQDNARIENFETTDDVENEAKFKIDYNFYNKFLTLQDFFRSPNQCYNKVRWRVFVNSATDILLAFQNFKLDADNFQGKPAQEHLSEASSSTFFAKYMTNPKLLELQLSDADFRRSMLIQFLIILQYLSSTVKFKLDTYELKPEQIDWIKEQQTLVYNLLAETPANSARFAESVKHLLAREELWNNWKNEGCPEFKKPATLDENEVVKTKPRPRKRNISELLKDAGNQKKYYMGHKELTRLWNLNPSNLEACKTSQRNFLPEEEKYFEEAIMQMDPAAGIEPEYKKVNDPNFGWRALRLLVQKNPSFFVQADNPCFKVSSYLENDLKRMMRDRPQNATEEVKQEVLNTEADDVDELLKKDENEAADKSEEKEHTRLISDEIIKIAAEHICEKWEALALELGFEPDDIKDILKKPTDYGRAYEVLGIWAEVDKTATPPNLVAMLKSFGFTDVANTISEKIPPSD